MSHQHIPTLLVLSVLVASVLSLLAYAWDKSCARRHSRRIPEKHLHLLALMGGWPGALLAQVLFRHKTQKASFRRVFFVTVAVHIVLVILLLRYI